MDNIKITLVQKIKTKEEKSREKFKRELYKQMSLTDKSFVRKAGNEEDDYKGSQIKQLPASMQNFYQTIYFNFMVTIDEVFPDPTRIAISTLIINMPMSTFSKIRFCKKLNRFSRKSFR